MSKDLTLRALTLADVPALALLTVQLGYDVTPEIVAARLEPLLTEPGNYLCGAVLDGALVAFMHCYDRPTLDKGHQLVVQSLVVNEDLRGTGAGRALMNEAERLAREIGCTEGVTLSSNQRRTGAHAFYERLGYTKVSTSYLFAKQI